MEVLKMGKGIERDLITLRVYVLLIRRMTLKMASTKMHTSPFVA
jgi:hypothetical protein